MPQAATNRTSPDSTRSPGTPGAPGNPGNPGTAEAVIGLQWGDEGKGKIIDLLAGGYSAVARYNGGANAGHSVVVKGERYALHLVPSGILHPGVLAVIGNGVVVDPEVLLKEIDALRARGVDVSGLRLSSRAHVVMPYHKIEDGLRETLLAAGGVGGPAHGDSGGSIGTTRRGIGPAYSDKAARGTALRVGDLLRERELQQKCAQIAAFKSRTLGPLSEEAAALSAPRLFEHAREMGRRLAPMVCDTVYLLHDLLREGKRVLFEGANATLLDVDHGTFPFVTSSSCAALGIPAGSGVPGPCLRRVVGVMKAYSTRVGGGPFPTELKNATGDRIRERGREYGTTTGRPRRCGWLDLVAVKYSAMINGATGLAVMLLDVLAGFDELKVCTAYEIDGVRTERFVPDAADLSGATPVFETLAGFSEEITRATARGHLPDGARRYLDFIEEFVGVPIEIVSVGPDRAQTIVG